MLQTQKRRFLLIFILCLIASITCLTNTSAKAKITCSLKKNTLTIKGKGKIPSSLKLKGKKKVRKIVIKSGVTSLPKRAFFKWPKLEEITVANTVKSIGDGAFMDCPQLKKIIIPGKFKRPNIKQWELMNEPVTTIMFTSSVDLNIARDLPAKSYVVSPKDSHYKSIQGCIYTKNGKSLVCIPSHIDNITTAPGCTDFNLGAPTNFTEITLSKEIATISTSKRVSDSRSSFSILTSQLPADHLFRLLEAFPTAVIKRDKNNAETYDASALPPTVKKEGDCYIMDDILFYYAGEETSFTIPNGVRKIAAKAFAGKNTLTSVNIPEGVTHIGADAMYNCKKLKAIYLPESLTYMGERAFANTYLESIKIPSKLKTIPAEAFHDSNIKSLIIPDNIEVIALSAFESNYITSLKLGKNVRRIESCAFAFNKLKTLSLPKKLTYIGDSAFDSNQLTKLTIPKNVKIIKDGAFCSQRGAMDLQIQGNPDKYHFNAFYASQYTYKKGLKRAFTIMLEWEAVKISKPNKITAKIEWGKINGANGYELKISTDPKMKKKVSKKTIDKNKTKTTIKIYNKRKDHDMYCMIRPFTKKKGKKVYGRWTKNLMEISDDI